MFQLKPKSARGAFHHTACMGSLVYLVWYAAASGLVYLVFRIGSGKLIVTKVTLHEIDRSRIATVTCIRALEVSVAGLNHRYPRPTPRRAERKLVSSSEIKNFL